MIDERVQTVCIRDLVVMVVNVEKVLVVEVSDLLKERFLFFENDLKQKDAVDLIWIAPLKELIQKMHSFNLFFHLLSYKHEIEILLLEGLDVVRLRFLCEGGIVELNQSFVLVLSLLSSLLDSRLEELKSMLSVSILKVSFGH